MAINPDDFIAIKEVYPETYRLGVDGAFKEDGSAISIDQSSIDTKKIELASQEYRTKRAEEYPSIRDQLDMIYWDKKNGTTTWDDAVKAVKDKYPKP